MEAVNPKPAPTGFVVLVWFDLVPPHAAAFRSAMLTNARASLGEPGCRQFDVCFTEDGARCFLYEVYDDAAAFEAHKRTPHFLAFDDASRAMVTSKRVETWGLAHGAFATPKAAR